MATLGVGQFLLLLGRRDQPPGGAPASSSRSPRAARLQARRAPGHAGVLGDAVPRARSSCCVSWRSSCGTAGSAWRSGRRPPTPTRPASTACSPAACRRWRGPSPAASRPSPPCSCSRPRASPPASRSGPACCCGRWPRAVVARMDEPARSRWPPASASASSSRCCCGTTRAAASSTWRCSWSILVALVVQRRQGGRDDGEGELGGGAGRGARCPTPRCRAWSVRYLGMIVGARRARRRPRAAGVRHQPRRRSCSSRIMAFAIVGLSVGDRHRPRRPAQPRPVRVAGVGAACRTTCRRAHRQLPAGASATPGSPPPRRLGAHRPAGAAHPGPDADRHHAGVRAGRRRAGCSQHVDVRRRRRPGPADRVRPPRSTPASAYYFFALAVLVLVLLLARNVRRGGFGRLPRRGSRQRGQRAGLHRPRHGA